MKVSELKFEQCIKEGEDRILMPYDSSDCLSCVNSQEDLDRAVERLMSTFGDVSVELHFDKEWFDRVTITDENWLASHKKYCEEKLKWCNKYGCD